MDKVTHSEESGTLERGVPATDLDIEKEWKLSDKQKLMEIGSVGVLNAEQMVLLSR